MDHLDSNAIILPNYHSSLKHHSTTSALATTTFSLPNVVHHMNKMKASTEEHKAKAEAIISSLNSTADPVVHQQLTTLVSSLDSLSLSLGSIVSLSTARRVKRAPCSKILEVLLAYDTALIHVENIISQLDAIGVTGIPSVDTFVATSRAAFETKLATLSHILPLIIQLAISNPP